VNDRNLADMFLTKAEQSLAGAESELVSGRYDNCANRCYYACFQAAVAALTLEGVRADGRSGHDAVQAQFVDLLINHRKRYYSGLRRMLADNQALRTPPTMGPTLVRSDRRPISGRHL